MKNNEAHNSSEAWRRDFQLLVDSDVPRPVLEGMILQAQKERDPAARERAAIMRQILNKKFGK